MSSEPDIVERTFAFSQRVKRLCRYLRDEARKERNLANQLERAGSSVGALVEEAQGAESKKDFVHKMSVAQKEARESHFWLRQLETSGAVSPERIADLTDEARQLKLILAAIINSTKRGMKEDGKPDPEETDQDKDASADEEED